jgi:hypothetical protein
VAAVIQAAAGDRRMQKAYVKVHMGGAPAAVEAYSQAPTPNVIVLESHGERSGILGHLDTWPRCATRAPRWSWWATSTTWCSTASSPPRA